jgi:signal transduction histidine kinase
MNTKMNEDTATIMLVDDTPTNLSVLIDYLNDFGFEILIAVDGEGALISVEAGQPDLILLDIMMPGMDGYETCRRLKQNPTTSDIPVIFISALSESMDKVKGFSSGGVDYITKPFQQDEVLARITTHLTIQRQKKELEALNVTKDKFFSVISHDMRGIFTPIVGSTDLIKHMVKKYDDPKLTKFTNNLSLSVKNALKLFENLLEWSRIQRGGITFAPVHLSLKKLIEQSVELFKEHQKSKKIEIINNIPADYQVKADKDMIQTVVRNLVSNGLKFTHSGGTITIDAKKNENRIEVSVTDSGIGMSPENVSSLFSLKQTKSKKGTGGERGTGLGLILCKDFIEKNGGKIWVNSVIGKGTSFMFTLEEADNGHT